MLCVRLLGVDPRKVVVTEPLDELFCLCRPARPKHVLEGLGLVLFELLQDL